ncbi:MAG: hypothetical protein ACI97X_001206 [Oceanospirillaceae bacterium]
MSTQTKTTMSNFTPTKCYNLTKYDITFDKIGISIIDSSTKKVVETQSFAKGFDIMVHDGDFCFGDITFDKSFTNTVDLTNPKAGVLFQESTERIIGSSESGDPGIAAHLYYINLCPVRLQTDRNNTLNIKCPCDKDSGPCSNKCYKFDTWK